MGKAGSPVPSGTQALINTAARMAQAGSVEDAIAKYREVLTSEPGHVTAHAQLGNLLVSMGRIKDGAAHIERSVPLAKATEGQALNLANQLARYGEVDRATKVADRFLMLHPKSPSVLTFKGVHQEKQNRHGEAMLTFRMCLKLAPGAPQATAGLARCYRRRKEYREAKTLLEACIASRSATDPSMNTLFNELGVTNEKLGLYDDAFEAYRRCGELERGTPEAKAFLESSLHDDIDRLTQWVQSGRFEETRERLIHPRTVDRRQLVFLLGFPRSGTTLTESVLSSHSQIESSDEMPLLSRAIKYLSEASGERDLVALMEGASAAGLAEAREAYWAEAEKHFDTGASVFIDKMPLNVINLPIIDILFPDSKIIVALRDPRDVCLSCFAQLFRLNAGMAQFTSWPGTTDFYRRVMGYWGNIKQSLRAPWVETRYEDLVVNLRERSGFLLEHIGVSWEDAILDHHEKAKERTSRTPNFQAIREPIHNKAIGKWKNYPSAMTSAHGNLHRFVEQLGYDG